jgi:hypothetical protein
MKRIIFLLAITFSGSTIIYGQTTDSLKSNVRHEASFDIGAFYTPVLSKDFYGVNIDFKYYPYQRIATGFSASMTNKKINNSFQYTIGQPIIYYYEFGWINQYEIIQTKKIRVGLNINNGIVISELGDNTIKQKVFTGRVFVDKAKVVETNYFYLLQPGLDISIRLLSKNNYPDLYLTTKAKYRFVFGDSKYGHLNDFSNFYFGLGLSIIGFIDEEPKK